MLRRFALTLALTGTFLVGPSLVGSSPAHADNSTVDRQVNLAAKTARRTYKAAAKEALTVLNTAGKNLISQLNDEAITIEAAASGYGPAMATYLHTLTKLANDASTTVSDAASSSLADTGSTESCTATLSGGGGGVDKFSDLMQKELDRGRARALKLGRRFMAQITRAAGRAPTGDPLAKATMRIAPLVFEFSPAPNAAGSLAQGDRPLRLQMWFAVFTRTAGLVITVSGTADPSHDNQFDVRLSRNGHIPVGEFVRNGGVDVNADGQWVTSETLGDPSPPAFGAGNRVLLLGTEPRDVGAGPDPTRLVQVGVVGVR